MKKRDCALITGITGQDGSYLAELLISKGYKVVGTTRNIESAGIKLPDSLKGIIELTEWDLLDVSRIKTILKDFSPTEVYNFSAYSSGSGMYDDPIGICNINGLAVTLILEAIREIDLSIRFCQASSSELFGNIETSPQSESTKFKPRSPYGAAKLYAHNMIEIYRQRYGIYACSAILFNHESARRGLEFVTRKITYEASRIKLGLSNELHLGNLDARRDWGYAGDYVQAMFLMLKQQEAEDFVIATGETHSVREFCEITFSYLKLDYRDFVLSDSTAYRSDETCQLVGNAKKAKQTLGWVPSLDFKEMIHLMVDADLHLLRECV